MLGETAKQHTWTPRVLLRWHFGKQEDVDKRLCWLGGREAFTRALSPAVMVSPVTPDFHPCHASPCCPFMSYLNFPG